MFLRDFARMRVFSHSRNLDVTSITVHASYYVQHFLSPAFPLPFPSISPSHLWSHDYSILVICMLRIHSVCSYRDSVSRACVAHWISRPHRPRCQHNLTTVKPKFHSARHVSSRHVRRVKPMHFGCVELVEQNGLTRSTRGTFRVETWRDVTSQVKFGFNTVLGVG